MPAEAPVSQPQANESRSRLGQLVGNLQETGQHHLEQSKAQRGERWHKRVENISNRIAPAREFVKNGLRKIGEIGSNIYQLHKGAHTPEGKQLIGRAIGESVRSGAEAVANKIVDIQDRGVALVESASHRTQEAVTGLVRSANERVLKPTRQRVGAIREAVLDGAAKGVMFGGGVIDSSVAAVHTGVDAVNRTVDAAAAKTREAGKSGIEKARSWGTRLNASYEKQTQRLKDGIHKGKNNLQEGVKRGYNNKLAQYIERDVKRQEMENVRLEYRRAQSDAQLEAKIRNNRERIDAGRAAAAARRSAASQIRNST